MLSLIVLQGPGKGRVFRLTGDRPMIIGRQVGDLRLMDPKISRRHAEIIFENGVWILRDLGSTNGTFVNGQLANGMVELEEGDQLKFGQFVLVVGPLAIEAPALDDTKLVDAESMDHVALSPHVPEEETESPSPESTEEESDVLHIEPIEHDQRPEQPPAAPPAEESTAGASMFDADASETSSAPSIEPESPAEVADVEVEQVEVEAESEAGLEAETDIEADAEPEPDSEFQMLSQAEPEPIVGQDESELPPSQEEPAGILETVMENPFEMFDHLSGFDDRGSAKVEAEPHDQALHEEPPPVQERLVDVSAEASQPHDEPQPGLRSLKPMPRSRLLWPLLGIGLLLALVGGGTGYWMLAGRSASPEASSHPSDAVSLDAVASTAKSEQPAAPDTSPTSSPSAPQTMPSSRKRVVVVLHPGQVTPQSMLDDGPQLVGKAALRRRVRQDADVAPASPPASPASPAKSAAAATDATTPTNHSETVVTQPVEDQAPEPAAASPGESQTSQPPAPSASPPPPAAAAYHPNRVAYLIDASGSLVDTLPELLNWLDSQLQKLDPQIQYTIIFFRAGDAVEVPPTGLKDACDADLTRQVRQWIGRDSGNVLPAGRSDPRAAINLALHYQVGQIYMLSDGHVGDRLSDEQIADYLVQLEQEVGPQKLAINNVQFFYPQVQGMLAHLVRRYPGQRTFIEPAAADQSADSSALSELNGASQ